MGNRLHRSHAPLTECHVPPDLDRPTLLLQSRDSAMRMAIRPITTAARRAARRAANRRNQSLAMALAKALVGVLFLVLVALSVLTRLAPS
jgi:hypothetical protein